MKKNVAHDKFRDGNAHILMINILRALVVEVTGHNFSPSIINRHWAIQIINNTFLYFSDPRVTFYNFTLKG
jgi:hypothetical protein